MVVIGGRDGTNASKVVFWVVYQVYSISLSLFDFSSFYFLLLSPLLTPGSDHLHFQLQNPL
jgi:hypothetical protein